MEVIVKGVHVRVSERLRQYVQTRLVKPLSKLFHNSATTMEVHFLDANGPKGGVDKECRVTVHIPGLKSIHLEEVADSTYKVVDQVKDRIERMVKRELGRRSSRQKAWAMLGRTGTRGGVPSLPVLDTAPV